MKIELFALCDGAYNYNGKLTIVGTLSEVKVASVPTKINIGLALKMQLDANESIGDELEIVFLDPDGSEIPVDIKVNLEAKIVSEMSYISLAANFQGIPVSLVGCHHVVLKMGDKDLAEYTFKIVNKD